MGRGFFHAVFQPGTVPYNLRHVRRSRPGQRGAEVAPGRALHGSGGGLNGPLDIAAGAVLRHRRPARLVRNLLRGGAGVASGPELLFGGTQGGGVLHGVLLRNQIIYERSFFRYAYQQPTPATTPPNEAPLIILNNSGKSTPNSTPRTKYIYVLAAMYVSNAIKPIIKTNATKTNKMI
ncbi:hypothetical protein D3C76_1340210 [compost metagenome]